MEIDDLIVEGDTVAIRNTWYGTQSDEFYGIPPSGKSVAVTSVGIDRVQDGLVTEGWGELDMVGMMQAARRAAHRRPRRGRERRRPERGARPRSAVGRRPASLEENRAILRALRRALDGGDREAVEAARRRGRVRRPQPRLGHARASTRCSSRPAALRAAMPDLAYEVDATNMVSEGNQVAGALGRPRARTPATPLYGAEPSGKEIVWTHSDFVRLRDGKIVERWSATDMLTLFQQAGVLRAVGRPAGRRPGRRPGSVPGQPQTAWRDVYAQPGSDPGSTSSRRPAK